jgi:hypothetical protein
MFGRWCVVRVALPRDTWEPLRKLVDVELVCTPGDVASAWGVSLLDMERVLAAARLRSLFDGEDVGVDVFHVGD